MTNCNYISQLNALASKEYTGAKLGLERVRDALYELGNPQDRCVSIHIAGTNGKGSTAAMLYEILVTAGYRVGFYTSPHFLNFRERIQINKKLIPRQRLEQILVTVFATKVAPSLTYFEILTIAAFKYFADEGIDVLVCEVGLGGRLDATNIIAKPLVSIITSIDYDHMEFLGDDLAHIAREKAGIIKRGVTTIVNTGHHAADTVIKQRCAALRAPSYFLKQDFYYGKGRIDWQRREQIFSYYGINVEFPNLHMQLLGAHQIRNASLALAALEIVNAHGKNKGKKKEQFTVTEDAIRVGLQRAKWVGRIDVRENITLEKASGDSSGDVMRTIILDGAHNVAGAKVLRATLATSPYVQVKPLTLVMSVLRDKDYRKICQQLHHIANKVIIFTANSARALDGVVLRKEWLKYLPEHQVFCAANLREGLKLLTRRDKVVCVTGSLYGISEMLEILKKQVQ